MLMLYVLFKICLLLLFVFLTSHPIVVVFSQPRKRALASSFSRFLDHTQRRATVGRTPLEEWSIRRRDLYLTTHNTHNKHPCPRWNSNPQSQRASGRRPTQFKICICRKYSCRYNYTEQIFKAGFSQFFLSLYIGTLYRHITGVLISP